MIDLAVRYWGEGPRSALLIHGLSSNAAGWWRLGPDLAAAGFEVTAPDLRGHGDSPKADDYRLASYAADVLALGAGWDVVLGHSLGGAVALVAAAGRPDWAGSMILEDPALAIPDPDGAREWLEAPFEGPMTTESVAAANPSWHPTDCRHKADALRSTSADVVRRTLADNPDWNLLPLLADLSTPTLLLGADAANGPALPVGIGELAASSYGAIGYTMIAGSTHSIHRDSYEPFLDAVLAAIS